MSFTSCFIELLKKGPKKAWCPWQNGHSSLQLANSSSSRGPALRMSSLDMLRKCSNSNDYCLKDVHRELLILDKTTLMFFNRAPTDQRKCFYPNTADDFIICWINHCTQLMLGDICGQQKTGSLLVSHCIKHNFFTLNKLIHNH